MTRQGRNLQLPLLLVILAMAELQRLKTELIPVTETKSSGPTGNKAVMSRTSC